MREPQHPVLVEAPVEETGEPRRVVVHLEFAPDGDCPAGVEEVVELVDDMLDVGVFQDALNESAEAKGLELKVSVAVVRLPGVPVDPAWAVIAHQPGPPRTDSATPALTALRTLREEQLRIIAAADDELAGASPEGIERLKSALGEVHAVLDLLVTEVAKAGALR